MPPAAIQKQWYLNWYLVLIKNSFYIFFFFFFLTHHILMALWKKFTCIKMWEKVLHFVYILLYICDIELLGRRTYHTYSCTYRTWPEDLWLFTVQVKYKGKKNKFLIIWKSFPQGPRPVTVESEALCSRGCLPTCFCGACHQGTQHPLQDSP